MLMYLTKHDGRGGRRRPLSPATNLMAKRFRNHNPNQYVLFSFFIFDNALELKNVVHRKRTL